MLIAIMYAYVWLMLTICHAAGIFLCRDECGNCPCEDNLFKEISKDGWKDVLRMSAVYLVWPIVMPIACAMIMINHKMK